MRRGSTSSKIECGAEPDPYALKHHHSLTASCSSLLCCRVNGINPDLSLRTYQQIVFVVQFELTALGMIRSQSSGSVRTLLASKDEASKDDAACHRRRYGEA